MAERLKFVGASTWEFSYEQLASRADVVAISERDLGRSGLAVPLSVLLSGHQVSSTAELVLTSSNDGFSARLPFVEAVEVGLIWFASLDGPLTAEQGGPFRFLIPNAAACKTAVLDTCSNVKFVDQIEVHEPACEASV